MCPHYVLNKTRSLYYGLQCPTSSCPYYLSDSICYKAPPSLCFSYSGLRWNTPSLPSPWSLLSLHLKLFTHIFTELTSYLQLANSSNIPTGKVLSVSYPKQHTLTPFILLVAPTATWNYIFMWFFFLPLPLEYMVLKVRKLAVMFSAVVNDR